MIIFAHQNMWRLKMATLNETDQREALANSAQIAAAFFRGLSDANRLQIISMLLEEGEMSVGELVERLDVSQPRVSAHLACLRTCGFVSSKRHGKYVYYGITDDRVRDFLRIAQTIVKDNARRLACELVN
jgi:DNA-binding transcriptional ArsR family regulator|tara:strand:+ start:697 stop:1086 length:390 start_codon:yes stop_codon:yes gene_type:complete